MCVSEKWRGGGGGGFLLLTRDETQINRQSGWQTIPRVKEPNGWISNVHAYLLKISILWGSFWTLRNENFAYLCRMINYLCMIIAAVGQAVKSSKGPSWWEMAGWDGVVCTWLVATQLISSRLTVKDPRWIHPIEKISFFHCGCTFIIHVNRSCPF